MQSDKLTPFTLIVYYIGHRPPLILLMALIKDVVRDSKPEHQIVHHTVSPVTN